MRSTTTLVTLTCLLSATNLNAGCPAKMSGSLQQIVRRWVDDNQPNNVFGLCAVALDKNGNEGFACSGKADKTHGLDKNTIFRIGSITKTMTAALLAKRVSEGSFQLSNRLDPHLPPAYRRQADNPITIQNLATYHSGLKDNPDEWRGAAHGLELLDEAIDAGWLALACNCYFYSNWGYQILGYALAYEDMGSVDDWWKDVHINVLVLNNMQVTKTYEEWQASDASYFKDHAASGHKLDSHNKFVDLGNGLNPRCPTANPSGCLYSSPHDMRLWLQYMMGLVPYPAVMETARHHLRQAYAKDEKHPDNELGLAWKFSHDPATQCHQIPGPTIRYYTRVSKSGDLDGQHAFIEYLQDPNDPDGVSPLGVFVVANSDPKGSMTVGALAEDLLSKIPLP